jgi:hypothetical protein
MQQGRQADVNSDRTRQYDRPSIEPFPPLACFHRLKVALLIGMISARRLRERAGRLSPAGDRDNVQETEVDDVEAGIDEHASR